VAARDDEERRTTVIVDIHYHYSSQPADSEAGMRSIQAELHMAKRLGMPRTLDEILPGFRDRRDDPHGDRLISRMDEAGIDVTAVCVVDAAGWGGTDEQAMATNQSCAEFAAQHPRRMVALASVDPRRSEAPAMLRRCLTEFGMKGLKWHPDFGFYPNSPEALEVLKVATEFGVPLLTHCSPLPGTWAKYAQPIYLDDVALVLPELEIIAAHMGGYGWWRDWAAIAQYKQTVSGDLAMWQFLLVVQPARFRSYLREILDLVGPDQVLFATDGPGFEGHVSNQNFVERLKALVADDGSGIVFTQAEVDAILGDNAARILRLV